MRHALRRIIRNLNEVRAELDYTQRRLMEIRTGVTLTRPEERPPLGH